MDISTMLNDPSMSIYWELYLEFVYLVTDAFRRRFCSDFFT